MDFDSLLSGYKAKTCVISVERFPDGGYGNMRIVAGNKAHCDDMLQTIGRPFVPDSPYEAYFPKDKNFEDFVTEVHSLASPCIPTSVFHRWGSG